MKYVTSSLTAVAALGLAGVSSQANASTVTVDFNYAFGTNSSVTLDGVTPFQMSTSTQPVAKTVQEFGTLSGGYIASTGANGTDTIDPSLSYAAATIQLGSQSPTSDFSEAERHRLCQPCVRRRRPGGLRFRDAGRRRRPFLDHLRRHSRTVHLGAADRRRGRAGRRGSPPSPPPGARPRGLIGLAFVARPEFGSPLRTSRRGDFMSARPSRPRQAKIKRRTSEKLSYRRDNSAS